MKQQLYIKVEDAPIDEEDLKDLKIPKYIFNGIEYIKINVCDYVRDYEKYSIVDIELSEMKENDEQGVFNRLGTTPKKDFFPIETSLIIEENKIK